MAKLTLILLALLTSRASGRLPTYQPTDQPVQWCANRGDDCNSASECCDGRACYERRGHEAYGTCETSCPDDDEYACRAENAQPAYQPTYKPTQSGGGDCADDETWEYLWEVAERQVDILEAHWACDDALIDEIQAKVMRANIDSEYGKSVENPAEWEHSLDYFWDFHGPNPNPTTGYQADY